MSLEPACTKKYPTKQECACCKDHLECHRIFEDIRMFLKNDSMFEVVAQKVAKEEGMGKLSTDELEWTRRCVLKSMIKIAEEK